MYDMSSSLIGVFFCGKGQGKPHLCVLRPAGRDELRQHITVCSPIPADGCVNEPGRV